MGEAHPPALASDSLKNRGFDFLDVLTRRDKAGSTQLNELRRLVKFQHQRTQREKVIAFCSLRHDFILSLRYFSDAFFLRSKSLGQTLAGGS